VPTYTTVAQIVIVCLCAFIYLLLAVAFGFYGFKFYAVFVEIGHTLTVHQQKRRTVITKLLNITVLFTIFFTARFVVVILGILYELTACIWYFDPVYYLVCELLAISLMFLVFKSQSGKEDRSLDAVGDPEQLPINQPAQGWYSKGVNSKSGR